MTWGFNQGVKFGARQGIYPCQWGQSVKQKEIRVTSAFLAEVD